MRKLQIAAVATAALLTAISANAADMAPVLKAPVKTSGYNWSGFYAGVHLGGITAPGAGFSDVGIPVAGAGAVAFTNAQAQALGGNTGGVASLMGGLQLGYNWQLNRSYVAGFETDISFVARKSRSFSNQVFDAADGVFVNTRIASSSPIAYIGTVRGRLGYLLSDPLLLYVTGGLAYAEIDTSANLAATYPLSIVLPNGVGFGGRTMRAGYTIGGGVEYAFTQKLSLKLEGLYYDLGSATATTTFRSFNDGGVLVSSNTLSKTLDLNGAIARVGLNYKF